MVDYKPLGISKEHWNKTKDLYKNDMKYPNWIIPDVRFPNEVEAIKERGGIVIRVNRSTTKSDSNSNHESEIALDHYHDFDAIINNDKTIGHLTHEVMDILKTTII